MQGRTFYSIMGRGGSLVGACGENKTKTCRWITNEIYEHLLSKFYLSGALFSQSLFSNTNNTYLSGSSQSLLISGLADKNGWVDLDELYVLDSEAGEEIPDGDYSLKLLDANSNILLDQSFGVFFTLLSDPPIDLNMTVFVFTVPFPEETHKIQIDFNGQTRAERLVSANQPNVSFVSPSGGEEWGSIHAVEWNAGDLDGDTLSFVLQYSTDNGLTWNPLAIDLNEESFELNAGHLTPSENYKLKVIATDGVLTGEAISNAFTVRNPDIDVQPWKLDFGEVEQGTITTQNADLANTGNASLEVSGYSAPENANVSGLSLPFALLPSESVQFQVDVNTALLEGPIDANIVFYSNDPNEAEKHLFIEGSVFIPKTMDGNLHLADMPSYQKEQNHYSGVTTAQMILNYIREAAGYPELSQDKIYTYGHLRNRPENSVLLELDAKAMDAVLGHFDPYDRIITVPYDSYDSREDGNPYQGYNYTIDAYEAGAINDYMKGIAHWMAYPVKRKAWWLDDDLVAEPYTPAALPIYGSYDSWVVVNGFAASNNPVPFPDTDPWYTAEVTIYGFWLTDPATGGIGQHVYVTAADANAFYFKPMDTNDTYHGKYLQIAEPPVLPPEGEYSVPKEKSGTAKIALPAADQKNLEYIGVTAASTSTANKRKMPTGMTAIAITSTEVTASKNSWKDLVDFHLLFDAEAVTAFEGAVMGKFYEVQSYEAGNYYLVPYEKDGLATGVIMLDAADGHFQQATWTAEPEKYLPIGEKRAVSLAKKAAANGGKRIKFKVVTAVLEWEGNDYSASPFIPYWKVTLDEQVWAVTQEGTLEKQPGNNWCEGADINRDGTVNLTDLAILKESWSLICDAQNQYCDNADINQDGKADLTDLYILQENYGRTDCRQ